MKKLLLCLKKNKEIAVLQAKLEGKDEILDLAKSKTSNPKSINIKTQNNTVNNILTMNVLNLSADKIRPVIDDYTIEHYLKGAEGMVEWMIDKILTDEEGKLLYICTDKNRKHFFYLDENKEKVEDIKAQRLLAVITPQIIPKLQGFKKSRNNEIIEEFFGETQAHDDRIFEERRKNKKLYDEALGSKMCDKLIEKTYTSKQLVK